MHVLGLVLAAASAIAAIPAAVFCLEIVAAVGRRRTAPVNRPAHSVVAGRPSVAVLVPAHNEADGIDATLRSIRAQVVTGDRVVVIADNCSDDTAAVARSGGAEVVERDDLSRRGKGYALDHGVRFVDRMPPSIGIVIDADCEVTPGAIDRLAFVCASSGRPVQALYAMQTEQNAAVGRRIAAFAWRIKNDVRPLGAAALGWPCQLMGTGMAFPWSVLRAARLASPHLVEDMQLGVELASLGNPPCFCAEAVVRSRFASSREGEQTQRVRWEHGHLSMIASAGPRSLIRAITRGDACLFGLALDLMVPPLASLVLLLTVLFVADVIAAAWGASPVAALVTAGAMSLVAIGVFLGWRLEGRDLLGPADVLSLPRYVLAKVPIYLRLLTGRQVEWVRTRRDVGNVQARDDGRDARQND